MSADAVDPLEAETRKMSDAELRAGIEAIRGNPKRAGSRARRLNMAESLALVALMAEEARRVKVAPAAAVSSTQETRSDDGT